MFDDTFSQMFGQQGSQKVGDTTYGAQSLDEFEYRHALRGHPPAPRRCQTDGEMASWLMKFAVACRANLLKTD